jgi:hypothetical protein
MEALGQITGMKIVSGAVELKETEQIIDCIGLSNGKVYQIHARWANGLPSWIRYRLTGVEI